MFPRKRSFLERSAWFAAYIRAYLLCSIGLFVLSHRMRCVALRRRAAPHDVAYGVKEPQCSRAARRSVSFRLSASVGLEPETLYSVIVDESVARDANKSVVLITDSSCPLAPVHVQQRLIMPRLYGAYG